ncbi:hypothetical protein PIB30_018978 [Stylosanthes scabra]|uniref:Uncharacterized protein n=1 Tax=Stylosanthes scabra TaxID=79078 RepID=A0ABU6Q854_9FABA|nr:hypothetical protein [Stylosanthes scabra]
MFCESDDISIERVALHDNWDDAEGYYRCWLGAWKPSWRDGWCACELACGNFQSFICLFHEFFHIHIIF